MQTDSNENVQPDMLNLLSNEHRFEEQNENHSEQLGYSCSKNNGVTPTNHSTAKMTACSSDYAFACGAEGDYHQATGDLYNTYGPSHGGSSSQDTLDMEIDTSGTRMYTSTSYQQRHPKEDTTKEFQMDKVVLRSSNQNQQQSGYRNSNRNDKKISPLTHLLLYSEDMRISKILRRLLTENNAASALDLCKKLEVAVRKQANTPYICRAFENLAKSIITVLKLGPAQCLEQVAIIFGLMGYINRSDFPVYKNYVIKAYNSTKDIQKYLMLALKTTFSCDAVNLDLAIYSDRVLVLLKDYLEDADIAENFIAISETIAEFSKNYQRAFEKHFTDIVDIVVGWHLEVEQPQALKMHCSVVLQRFSQFFLKKLDFTFGLMGQFLEDIASFGDDVGSSISSGVDHKNKTPSPEISVGSFVGAFNSIMKSLANKQKFLAFNLGKNLVAQATAVISKAAKQSFAVTAHIETVLSVNEFFCLILLNSTNDTFEFGEIQEIIQLQIAQLSTFNEQQVASLLFLIFTVVRQIRTQIPSDLVTMVLRVNRNYLVRTKLTRDEKNFKLLTKIYHEILMLKNVPLLQEAYRHIVYDMNLAICAIERQNHCDHGYSTEQAECVLNFYFSALSVLATQTSSIIGMYALKPSILELLIINCKAANMKLWSTNSGLHSAMLSLLSTHCQKNHNYRLSSRLLKDNLFLKLSLDDTSTSPTSENFNLILEFLAEILASATGLSKYNLKLILSWANNLLEECRENSDMLQDNELFVGICSSICAATLICSFECARCLEVIQTYQKINEKVLRNIRDVAVFHMSSVDSLQRNIYSRMFARLPLRVTMPIASASYVSSGIFSTRFSRANELHQWYISTSHTPSLHDKYFKPFLKQIALSPVAKMMDDQLKDIFPKCLTLQLRERAAEFFHTSLGNINMLISWIQWEGARYCVRNKLRTTLGKPQDTFLKIEATIMKYARVLALKDEPYEPQDVCSVAANQRNARILLGFLECLEKQIYNAAEGTAFAIPAPEKPAKTFFRVNTSTCKEWFNRIRTAVDLVANHSMEPAMVIRYSEVMLKSLTTAERSNELHIDHTIMSLVWALLRCGETDTLHGLYVWANARTPKRYVWIRFAADQAAGHKEAAAEGYANILSEGEKIDIYVREFILDQLFECLFYTNQWKKLRSLVAARSPEKRETMTLTCAHNISQLDELERLYYDYSNSSFAVAELTAWPTAADTINNESTNLSYYKVLQSMESTCINNVLRGCDSQLPLDCIELLRSGLQECFSRCQPSEHASDFIILNHVASKLLEANTSNTFECSDAVRQSTNLSKCLRWARLFERQRGGDIKHSMFLDVASCARKEGNLKLCESELERFFAIKGFNERLPELLDKLQSNAITVDISDDELLRGFNELSKCMYATPERQNEAIALASTCCLQVIETAFSLKMTRYPEATSKMLLTLSEWLPQRGVCNVDQSGIVPLQRLLESIPGISGDPDENINEIVPTADMAVGKLIQASVLQCNRSSPAWSAFGNWCYRWGKKVVEAKSDGNYRKAGLSLRDIDAIKELIGSVDNKDDSEPEPIESIVAILNKHQVTATDEDEDIESNEISSTELIENQLRKISALRHKPVHTITAIIRIWRQAHKSVYVYYEMAAESYFKYLSIETESSEVNGEDSSLVTATLRLLRLVVKHAFGLQEVLEEGLSTTPTRPWKVIIPQLFSRLNHHEPYVRKRVSELLCRVAKDSPHLIIFPAVVGAVQEDKKYTGDKDEVNPLIYCFNSLLSTLSNQAPETVQQVQLLVRELKRVTLLWDEFWIHSLAQLYSEYSALFNTFETETKKCTDAQYEILNAKHSILMSHVIADLRKLYNVTGRPAETNYERNFQEKYQHIISATIEELKKPFNLAKTNESWLKIKQLYTIFQQRAQRNFQSTLKMVDISPVLAMMKNTAISMPGVETGEKHPVYIRAVDNLVHILPTKTKPKKLAFFGSDGRKYTYLFKGLEDLHLDERIMQFLSISNSMMTRSSDCNANDYRAHHYSVIPLGPQSGLISWVDGVTPLFAIYKKWQQREATQTDRQTSATRPSEMFYNKLTPLLAEQNIKITDSRKLWPLDTLRKVLEELTKNTPRDLLAKELWCNSNNSADWRLSIRNYSLSVAVMSAIGYVIGLGDRHLDNVLIKVSTGEILHIDYNVCFEKGKTLRVPERVPFRMTPNLEEALGITGIEGIFRLGCEYVLKTLRKERETLLTLLEAFVYDPLVDWAVSDDGTTTSSRSTAAIVAAADIAALKLSATDVDTVKKSKTNEIIGGVSHKKIETEITRSTIGVRFAEIKPYWTQFRDEVTSNLLEINAFLEALQINRVDIHKAELERDTHTKQLAMIREVETLGSAMGSHSLNTISQRYNAYKKAVDDFSCVRQNVICYYKDLQSNIELYFNSVIAAAHTKQLNDLRFQLHEIQQHVIENEFEHVRELLENSAQDILFQKADFARKEMDNTLFQQAMVAAVCIDVLTQYTNVMEFFPRSRLRENRLVKYTACYEHLLKVGQNRDPSEVKDAAMKSFATASDSYRTGDAHQYAQKMEQIWVELNFDLSKTVSYLSEQSQHVSVMVESAHTGINSFVPTINSDCNETAIQSLQQAMLETLAKTNESFVNFEKSSMNATSNCETFILDQQIDYIEMILEMTEAAFLSKNHRNYEAIDALRIILQSLRHLQMAFHVRIPAKIVHLFMLDDHNADVQDILSDIIKMQGGKDEFNSIARKNGSAILADLIEEIESIFDDCVKNLKEAYQIMKLVWETLHDEKVKQLESRVFDNDSTLLFDAESKFQAISKIFQIAGDLANSLRESNIEFVYDVRRLSEPLIEFINRLQMKTLAGLTSMVAVDLHQKLTQDFQQRTLVSTINDESLSTAKALCQNLFVALQQNCTIEHLKRQVVNKTEWVEHYTLVVSAFHWMNESVLAANSSIYGHIISKEKLLSNLQSGSQSLSVWKITMEKIQTEIEENVAAVVQRLKWAVGDNQNLLQIQESFSECVAAQRRKYQTHVNVAKHLIEIAPVLMQFELFQMSAPNAAQNIIEMDRVFLTAVTQWVDSYTAERQLAAMITPVEQSIVQLLDPEGKLDKCWINNISGLLDEMTYTVQRQIADYECSAQKTQENILASANHLQSLINSQIRMDIRQLLKLIAKVNCALGGSTASTSEGDNISYVREFQIILKRYFVQLNDLHLKLISRDFAEEIIKELRDQICDIIRAAQQYHVDLIDLVNTCMQEDGALGLGSSTTTSIQFLTTSATDKKGNQREQKRNAYAVSVWKRIRMKLEGRDPDPNRRSTIAEQVDFIIREATNPDNLAVLYEGWTPWV